VQGLKGLQVRSGRLSGVGRGESTRTGAPASAAVTSSAASRVTREYGPRNHSHSRVSDWLLPPDRLSSISVLAATPGCQIGHTHHTGCRQLVFWLSLPGVRLVTRTIPKQQKSEWSHRPYWKAPIGCMGPTSNCTKCSMGNCSHAYSTLSARHSGTS
jgi:hypothetical protein